MRPEPATPSPLMFPRYFSAERERASNAGPFPLPYPARKTVKDVLAINVHYVLALDIPDLPINIRQEKNSRSGTCHTYGATSSTGGDCALSLPVLSTAETA
jgi:hypothetical protein